MPGLRIRQRPDPARRRRSARARQPACLAEGISNVTLIFSLARYAEVVEAFLAGLEAARAAGRDLSGIASVAWGVNDAIQDLIRSGQPADLARLADPAVPLDEVTATHDRRSS